MGLSNGRIRGSFLEADASLMRGLSGVPAMVFFGILAAAGCSSHAEPPDVFPAIPEVRATNHVATLRLDAELDPATKTPKFAYEGRLGVTPTIRVSPGDTIELTVGNALPFRQNEIDAINIHFHGLTVSPNAPGDDSLMMLAKGGQTIHYHVRIPPEQEPGLYWYHPHSHGEAYAQVTSGMSGAIVVEGMERHLPALASMKERIIVLRDVPRYAGPITDEDAPAAASAVATGPMSHDPCRPETTLVPTLNGLRYPNIGIAPGERQFFRVVNASAARHFDLSIPGSRFALVALDGVALDAYPGSRATIDVGHIVVPPGGRAEFVVTGPAHPTVLQSTCFDSGSAGDADPIATLANIIDPQAVTGTEDPPLAPASPLAAAVAESNLPEGGRQAALPKAAAQRTIKFSEDANNFYIDGKTFDMNAPPAVTAHVGTTEEWTIQNDTDEVHDFHIHQIHFAAETIDGSDVRERHWQDTIVVHPRKSVKLLMDFRDPIIRGTFVYHCHILDHEDKGMMAKIRVI